MLDSRYRRSASSERAFSSAGITITKHRNRLKPDIVEALQFLKCLYHHNLLFREEASAQSEMEEAEDLEEVVLDNGEEIGWDGMVEDIVVDENFVDDEDDIYVQDIE